MIVYGINSIREALASSDRVVSRIIVAQGRQSGRIRAIVQLARKSGVPVTTEPMPALTRKAGTSAHQSIIAELSAVPIVELGKLLETKPWRVLLADGVEDPRNLGAVLRTAEAAGVKAVLLPHRHSCGVTGTVVRTSAGAALHVPVVRVGNVVQTLQRFKEAGYWVVGLDMTGSEDLSRIPAESRLVLAVGGENRGLRRLVKENCDYLIRLPMRGRVPSLNLSVATGILLFSLPWPKGAADTV